MSTNWGQWVREAQVIDAPYILRTWLSSYKKSPWAGSFDWGQYEATYSLTLNRLIQGGAKVHVVHNPRAPKQIVGWACTERRGHRTIVHYVFVKSVFRRQGVAHVLLKSAGIDSGAEFFYSFKTESSRYFKHGRYRPEAARNPEYIPNAHHAPAGPVLDPIPPGPAVEWKRGVTVDGGQDPVLDA